MKSRNLLVAAALFTPVVAGAQPSAPLSDTDVKATTYLHAVDQLEIDMGQLAKRNGSPAMQTFGAVLVHDYAATDRSLVAIARKHGLRTIPVEAPIDPDHRPVVDAQAKLKGMKGADFDKAFLDVMVDAQDAEVQEIENATSGISDPQLQKLFQDLDLTLKAHVITAHNLQH